MNKNIRIIENVGENSNLGNVWVDAHGDQNKQKHINKYTSNVAITLIALAITIIVLLILAGVTLSMVIGDSGIFNKAIIAKEKYQNSQITEQKYIENVTNKMDTIVGSRNLSEDEIKKYISEEVLSQLPEIYITDFSYTDNSYYKKYSNGIIEQGGNFSINGSTGEWSTFEFPTAFPNACISAQLTGGCGSSGWTYSNGTGISGTTKDSVKYSNAVGSGNVKVQWYAIGY